MMLHIEKSFRRFGLRQICKSSVAFYSKRSDSEISNSFKVINSDKPINGDIANASFGPSPNWELLDPHGYRFFLPGSVGPGWHDSSTIVQVQVSRKLSRNRKLSESAGNNRFKCVVQDCPILLRKGVSELFPGSNIAENDLSVITLMYESSEEWTPSQQVETDEVVAKYFVLAAQGICNKLIAVGYWADFINPFSGRPYLSTYQNLPPYETDEQLHCIGFEIENRADCKIIRSEEKECRKFNGSIFSSAPSGVLQLKNTLK